MSKKWTYVGTNSLEKWNPINNIEDPKEREKAKIKKSQKSLKQLLKINKMSFEKPKKKDKDKEESLIN